MSKNNKSGKSNVARLLDTAQIPYKLLHYEVDEEDLSATHLAETAGIDPALIYKTIVLVGDKTGPLVCVVPAEEEVQLKKAAHASGNKSVSPLPLRELQKTTGYIRGGCSPIGMKKPLPTLIDRSILAHDEVYISAGVRGTQVVIKPELLIAYVHATVEELV